MGRKNRTFTVIGANEEDGPDPQVYVLTGEGITAADCDKACDDMWVAVVLEGAHELNPDVELDEPAAWTVPGWYGENFQRYSAAVTARNWEEAVSEAFETCIDDNLWQYESREDAIEALDVVLVGAVFGSHQCVDVYAGDENWALPADERPDWQEFDYSM